MLKMNKALISIIILTVFTSCIHQAPKPKCDVKPDNYTFGYKENNGYTIYHSIEPAKFCSKQTGRPILIMFAGWRNISDRHLFWDIFQDKDVKQIINDNFLLVMLFVDDTTRLSTVDSSKKTDSGKIIETVGEYNLNFEIKKFQINATPLFTIVDNNMNILVEPIGFVTQKMKEQFVDFLMKGINK